MIEHGRKGFSYESFAGLIGVHVDTLYEWEKVHEEFSEAKKVCKAASLYVWEKMGVDGMKEKETDEDFEVPRVVELPDGTKHTFNVKVKQRKRFNNTNWIYNMKARFRQFGWNPHSMEAAAEEMGIDMEIIDDE